MSNISAPNFTQIPNVIFDYWLPILTPLEFKVLLVLCRKTFGWHKTQETIGIRPLAKYAGISVNSAQKAITCLIEHGLVIKQKRMLHMEGAIGPSNISNLYRLNVKKPDSPIEDEKSMEELGVIEIEEDPPIESEKTDQESPPPIPRFDTGGVSRFDTGVYHGLTQGRPHSPCENPLPKEKEKEKEKETNRNDSIRSLSSVKEKIQEKQDAPSHEEIDSVRAYALEGKIALKNSDIRQWSRKYGIDRTIEAIELAIFEMKSGDLLVNPAGWICHALKEGFKMEKNEI